MTAGELVALLTYVKTGNVGQLLDDFGQVTDDSGASTPLGDAAPFEYAEDAPIGEVQQDAGSFLTPEIEDECMQQHFIDMDDCSAMWSWGTRRWGMCKEQASIRLSRCLTGKGEID